MKPDWRVGILVLRIYLLAFLKIPAPRDSGVFEKNLLTEYLRVETRKLVARTTNTALQ